MSQQGAHRSTVPSRAPGKYYVLELLRYAAALPSDREIGNSQSRWEAIDDRQFHWIMDAGLGPLLYLVTRDEVHQQFEVRRNALSSADLTAQVRYGNLVDTACEIIDVCHDLGVIPTLLKGISISDQHYPLGHLRPMGDIDILVPKDALKSVESALLSRGYRFKQGNETDQYAYHGVPLSHPIRRTWVELHTGLFPENAPLRRNTVFSATNIAAQSVAAIFRGRRVYRFTDELQFLYTASFWIRDISRVGFHASFLPPLFDSIYLLKSSNQGLNWDEMLRWLDNDMASASLYILLTHLSLSGLYQPPLSVLSSLASRQQLVGTPDLRVINFMLNRYLIQGLSFTRLFDSWHVWESLLAPGPHVAKLLLLPWRIAFPSQRLDRYNVRYQLDRVGRRLRNL